MMRNAILNSLSYVFAGMSAAALYFDLPTEATVLALYAIWAQLVSL
jgi:hypothetical protein